jgi:hypothetical protein
MMRKGLEGPERVAAAEAAATEPPKSPAGRGRRLFGFQSKRLIKSLTAPGSPQRIPII